jgi:hypothetical protein
MCKRGSIVCKWRPCLPKGPPNSARMHTIVTAVLQRQYLQTELILWIRLVITYINDFRVSQLSVTLGNFRNLINSWNIKVPLYFTEAVTYCHMLECDYRWDLDW